MTTRPDDAVTTRTWPELRADVLTRAERGLTPFIGLSADDARAALEPVDSLDRNAWGNAWIAVGERRLAEAAQATTADEQRERLTRAWHAFNVGRWPSPLAPAKARSYERALDAFARLAPLMAPPVETLRIASPDGDIVARVRLPAGVRRAPVVLAISGLDSRKEDDIVLLSDTYLARGIGMVAVDMPGTGEAPLRNAPGAERMYARVLDAMAGHPGIDAGRVVVRGRSWGSYWAAVLAVTERRRLRGAVSHGGPVHHYFSRDWQERSLGTTEYLFDFFPALAAVYGATTLDGYLAACAGMSLEARGLLREPSAPMLVANGVRDTLVPIADLVLLASSGSAKDAWVNPAGAHMGRCAEWPQLRILGEVIVPWIARRLEA